MADFDRPLKKRGIRDAARIGHWLRDRDLVPDLILSSTAERAIATARLTCDAMGFDKNAVQEEPSLYHASLETLLAVIRGLPGSAHRVLIIGHNPGLEELLAALAETQISPHDDSGRMQTAALALMGLNRDWADTAPGTASIITIIRPRDLPPAD